MPNLNGTLSETVQQTNLRAAGLALLVALSRASAFRQSWARSTISICARA